MQQFRFAPGDTSKSIDVFLPDSSSTTGAGLSGLVFNTASLAAYYRNTATGTVTAITLATQTVGGAWSSGGFVELDATHAKGMYRLDLPDAVLASAGEGFVHIYGATNLAQTPVQISVGYVKSDVRQWGGSATPVTNITLAFATDFATLYDTTNKAFLAKLGNFAMGGSSLALTTGAIAGTTLTLSGAVAFQSTFIVTGATTFTGNVGLSDGLTIASPSTTNRAGITITGNGTGAGIKSTGGVSGPGMLLVGGASANGDGLQITGSAGHGIYVSSSAGNDGIHVLGNTTGHGLYLEAGSSGNGLRIAGGSSSGDGISITTISGHGINIAPVGTSKHGVLIVGGNGGTSDGLKLTAGTGGVGFRIDTMTVTTNAIAWNSAWDAEVQSEAEDALAVYDGPTHAEMTAELATADDATLAAIAALSIPTAAQNAAALMDLSNGVETGLTPRQALKLMVAACAGKLSGAATTTIVIRNAVADSKDRITATVDADGNRSAITVDLT